MKAIRRELPYVQLQADRKTADAARELVDEFIAQIADSTTLPDMTAENRQTS